jgi:hypothetical protein
MSVFFFFESILNHTSIYKFLKIMNFGIKKILKKICYAIIARKKLG